MPTRASIAIVLASLMVVSVAAQPVAGLAGVFSGTGPEAVQQTPAGETVSVGVGQQLSTVITATSVETESAVSADLFDQAFENATEEEKAALITARAESIEAKSADLQSEFENATAAYRNGSLSTEAYAQRLATFNARASSIEESASVVMDRAGNVSTLELRAAGYDEAALQDAVEDVESLTGVGLSAIYQRFTGEVDSNLSLSATDGLSVTAEEDGEYTREFERDGDQNLSYSVSQSDALETARETLTAETNGTWRLVDADVKYEYGTYRFEFELRDQGITGEAEATIDGSSGEILEFEEEIEREDLDDADEVDDDAEDEREDDEAEDEDDHEEAESDDADDREEDDETELSLLVTEGTIAPNETVVLQALRDGTPAANVSIEVNDVVVGETDANGTVKVTLPDHETEIEAGEASLSFEFENEERERQSVYERLTAEGSVVNGTVTISVTYDNESVGNASVWVNDELVGQTASDGHLEFAVGDAGELEVEIVKGEFEAELEFEQRDGTLVLVEGAREGDGDKVDSTDETEDSAEEAEESEDEEETEEREDENEDSTDDADADESDDADADDIEDDESTDPDDGETEEDETEDESSSDDEIDDLDADDTESVDD